MNTRRHFLQQSITAASALSLVSPVFRQSVFAADGAGGMPWGEGDLFSLSDGQLSLPASMVLPDSIDSAERESFLQTHQLATDGFKPDCNVTLWRSPDKVVLFDAGAGAQFTAGGGQLADSLAAAGVEASDVTDVVFTHAHPDHLWGVIDDFDEITFPEAQYHIHQKEWDYWLDSNTLSKTPDFRQGFVVGAQNRLPQIEERISFFKGGDEILPNVEAVNSHGHTPGHTSFVLHAGNESVMVLGDAITNAVVSFEKPGWPSGSDQDAESGIQTRVALLGRLAADKSLILGYHLPAPGIGRVEHADGAYRFAADV